jgi:hypothetical protein
MTSIKILDINKAQLTTAGHKTFGCQWFFEHSTPLKLLRSVDKNVARTPKRFHTGRTPLCTSCAKTRLTKFQLA